MVHKINALISPLFARQREADPDLCAKVGIEMENAVIGGINGKSLIINTEWFTAGGSLTTDQVKWFSIGGPGNHTWVSKTKMGGNPTELTKKSKR